MIPTLPTRPRKPSTWIPAALFLAAAGYLLLRSHVYIPPRTIQLSQIPLHTLEGALVPPIATQNKVIVLNFWAPWCGPCREELPWLQHLQQTHPTVAVLGIDDDSEGYEQAAAFAAKLGVTYPLIRSDDPARHIFGHVAALPTTLYITASGRVVHTVTGIVPESVMEHYLADAIASR